MKKGCCDDCSCGCPLGYEAESQLAEANVKIQMLMSGQQGLIETIQFQESENKRLREAFGNEFREMADRIDRSVNIKNIGQPSESIINCHIQSRYDSKLCRDRADEIDAALDGGQAEMPQFVQYPHSIDCPKKWSFGSPCAHDGK